MARRRQKPDDPIGRELTERLAATEQLLKAHKFEHTQAMVDAQGGEAEAPAASRLRELSRLELLTTNLRSFIRCRELTRVG